MYYVYVLKSIIKNFNYTGCCADLRKRFKQHNSGEVRSTTAYKPFSIIYYEACLDQQDAYKREKYLKTNLGKRYLRKRLSNWFKINEPRHV